MKRKSLVVSAVVLMLIAVAAWAVQTVNPYPSAGTAGNQLVTSNAPPNIAVKESNLVHPTHADGFVDTADPVLIGGATGTMVGVARQSATAATDYVTVSRAGVWELAVTPNESSPLAYGGTVWINTSTAVLQADNATATEFGYSLSEDTVTSPATTVVPISLFQP